jgi:GT2 family glycosyltransferase
MTAERPRTRVRAVVVNWNSAWYTRRCLRSLLATEAPGVALEIVVVDNGSTDGSLEQLRHLFPEVRFLPTGTNLGFAEGCNRAMRELRGVDHVALVNNDAVVEPGWLEPLVAALEGDAGAGAAAAALILDTGFAPARVDIDGGSAVVEQVLVDGLDVTERTRFAGVRAVGRVEWPMEVIRHLEAPAAIDVPAAPDSETLTVVVSGTGEVTLGTSGGEDSVRLTGSAAPLTVPAGRDRRELLNGLGTSLNEHNESLDVGFGEPSDSLEGRSPSVVTGFCGGAVLLRARMLAEVGVFDPRFFAYYEDQDLAWRARRAGWHTVAVPSSRVRHALGASGGARMTAFFYLNHRNWLLTTLRNGDRRQIATAFTSAFDRFESALRGNVTAPLRGRRAPSLRLVGAWARVFAGVVAAAPRTLWCRWTRCRFHRPAHRVRSRLQPVAAGRESMVVPWGPAVAYLDVGEAVGEGPEAEPARLARELLGNAAALDVVLVVEGDTPSGLRRLDPAECGRVLGTGPPHTTVDAASLALDRLHPRGVVVRVAAAGDGPCGPRPHGDRAGRPVIELSGADVARDAAAAAASLVAAIAGAPAGG